MKILITGAAGFIGSHTADALLKRGDTVIAVDNFNTYYSPKDKKSNMEPAKKHKNYMPYDAEILDIEGMKAIFRQEMPDKVIHLAARAGVRPSLEDPQLYVDVNVKGVVNMLELSREFKVKNFVFGSSSSVYGANKKVPFSETDAVNSPISPYAASKRAGELMCATYHHLYHLNISCMRFFTVYGPRGRPDMAPYKFTKAIMEGKEITMYGDGTTKRDYTYVDDIVSGIIAGLDRNYSFEIFNLGNSKTVSLKDFIATIESAVGKKAKIKKMPLQPGDVTITYADLTKSRKMLGYEPKTSIDEGIRNFVEWYTKNH
ncbi:MAG: GDP-mannose 4,6-dehydratase [Candidatus Aenigmarchaeota archaeon]|nr:GDP-mannose 4,6-dehydratase [Candidatus Aenigmarchaeota archaeon]